MDVGAETDAGQCGCAHATIMPHWSARLGPPRDHGGVTARTPRLVGALAAAAGLAAAELVAGVLGARESPVVSVAQQAIDLTPGAVGEPIIATLGALDKPLAIAVTIAAVLALGSLVGRWWVERRRWALGGLVVLAAVASAAVATRPYAALPGVVGSVAGALVVLGVLRLLLGPARRPGGAAPDADTSSRRRFLRNAAFVLAGTVVGGAAGQLLGARARRRGDIDAARAALRLPTRALATPAGVEAGVPGAVPWRTPVRDFYRIDTSLAPPLIDPQEWSLRIHGMVEKEITLTYADLVDRGLQDAWVTLCCVSNEVGGDLVGNAVWSGVPMADLLELAGPQDGADCLLSTSQDGWTCGTPLAALTDGRDALLAVAMDGRPLPVEHGFPVRQVVPGLYGYVSATKWVVDWEVTRFADVEAYWTQRGWGEQGPIKTQSRIDVPGDDVSAGRVAVAGVAWAQNTGIESVQVRVDQGPWQDAELASQPSIDSWVQWRWEWDAEPGRHFLQVRAADRSGYVQTAEVAGVLPDGATGYHGVTVRVE